MEHKIMSLAGKSSGKIELKQELFGLEPRQDIIQRMVRYQLAKRRSGTHDVKNRSEIRGSGRKIVRQKGSGGARHSTRKVNIFRGGGRAFGPTPRSHAFKLPKKVRALALKHALSAKAKANDILILDKAELKEPKTALLKKMFDKIGLDNALIIDGAQLDDNFAKASKNIPLIDVLPVQGINVYDILRRKKLVLTKAAIAGLEERLS